MHFILKHTDSAKNEFHKENFQSECSTSIGKVEFAV
jgi:hypothetical protein